MGVGPNEPAEPADDLLPPDEFEDACSGDEGRYAPREEEEEKEAEEAGEVERSGKGAEAKEGKGKGNGAAAKGESERRA